MKYVGVQLITKYVYSFHQTSPNASVLKATDTYLSLYLLLLNYYLIIWMV
jgi:hypothetical protein